MSGWEWMVQDGLGSVRGVVDNSVGVLESRTYDPYGELFGATGSNQTVYGFTGEPTDGNGLLYLRARYYNPAAGVFTTLDPFEGVPGRPMSLNGYSWVEGNTPNATDPSGMIYELPSMWDSCSGIDQSACLDIEARCDEYFAGDLAFAAQYPNDPASHQILQDYNYCINSCGSNINRPYEPVPACAADGTLRRNIEATLSEPFNLFRNPGVKTRGIIAGVSGSVILSAGASIVALWESES
jgi:RHS repeat-associated protein